jgi:hypothetical protein
MPWWRSKQLYFVDLGKPQGGSYTLLPDQGMAYRFYENGVVVVNDSGDSCFHAYALL